MTTVSLSVVLVVLSLIINPSAVASDFSQMGEPAFARSLMLSKERQNELNCAALASLPFHQRQNLEMISLPEDEPPISETDRSIVASTPKAEPRPPIVYEQLLSETDAEHLKTAVMRRLVSDIDDQKMATEHFGMRLSRLMEDWDTSAEGLVRIAKRREDMKSACREIFIAARSGDIEKVLTPSSIEPIVLPDIDTCLAYDLIAKKSPDYADYNFLHEDHGGSLYDMIVGPKGPRRKARETEIAEKASSLGNIDATIAARSLITCLPTFAVYFRR
jgi:hypothetical protein